MAKVDEQEIQRGLARIGYLGESRKRSWVKALVWRAIGIFILGAIAYAFTQNWQQTTIITVIFHIIRTILYYFYERGWDKASWGRIKAGGNE